MADKREVTVGEQISVTFDGGVPDSGGVTRETVQGEVLDVDESGFAVGAILTGERVDIGHDEVLAVGPIDPVLVRLYPGHTQADAASIYASEAVMLGRAGYLPVAQSWAVGEPGVGRVLALGAFGATALRPRGALTVAYVHRSAWRPPAL